MIKYNCFEQVHAEPLTLGEYNAEYGGSAILTVAEAEQEGYVVQYTDDLNLPSGRSSYISWSPKKAFENGYVLAGPNLSLGQAVEAAKRGAKIARPGWNRKHMFVYYVPAASYPATTAIAKDTFGDLVPYGAYLAMKTAQGNVVPWLASQTDILANDWEIVRGHHIN